ncbi:hypothetical protein BH10PSE9_BH10PSE9_21700 [soil metagenome]
MTNTRYWIGVASRDHVMRGVAGGFCQLSHGKSGPVKRLSPGDWLTYYSPRTGMRDGDPVQAFTAIGEIKPGEPYAGDMGGGFHPVRRDVAWRKAMEVSIKPLLDKLSFARGKTSWGVAFRRGSFEVSAEDFAIIATAMEFALLDGAGLTFLECHAATFPRHLVRAAVGMKRLRGRQFGLAVGWRVALFAALSFGFPFILYGLGAISNCRSTSGACGAVAAVGSMYLRPIIALGFLALMIGPPIRRTRALGLLGVAGLVIPLLLIADRQFLLLLGAHWSMGFMVGALSIQVPAFLGLALVLLVAMAIVREPVSGEDGLWRRHGAFGKATLTGILLVSALALFHVIIGLGSPLTFLVGMPPVGSLSLSRLWLSARQLGFYACGAAAVAVIVFVILDLVARGGRAAPPADGEDAGDLSPATIVPSDTSPHGSIGHRTS